MFNVVCIENPLYFHGHFMLLVCLMGLSDSQNILCMNENMQWRPVVHTDIPTLNYFIVGPFPLSTWQDTKCLHTLQLGFGWETWNQWLWNMFPGCTSIFRLENTIGKTLYTSPARNQIKGAALKTIPPLIWCYLVLPIHSFQPRK